MASPDASLFERLGGQAALAQAVDIFYRRVLADPTVASFFEGVDMGPLKVHQMHFLTYALGGPATFNGSMREAHAHLPIEKKHFYAVTDHMLATLAELGIDDDINAEVISLLEPLKREIVNTPAQLP